MLLFFTLLGICFGAKLRFPDVLEGVNPEDAPALHEPKTSPFMMVGDKKIEGAAQTLIRVGQEVNGKKFGAILKHKSKEFGWLHWSLDYSGMLEKDGKIYILSNFESRVGQLYITQVEQDKANGNLTPVDTWPLHTYELIHEDFHFISEPCSGSVTPWNTFLSSQEYPIDLHKQVYYKNGHKGYTEKYEGFMKYRKAWGGHKTVGDYVCKNWMFGSHYGNHHLFEDKSTVFHFHNKTCDVTANTSAIIQEWEEVYGSTYWNGQFIETIVKGPGQFEMIQHFAMGRLSGERAIVLPDKKTVYMTEDMSQGLGFYKYVAKTAEDLSEGELFVAKVNQVGEAETAMDQNYEITWISLGVAKDSDFTPELIKTASTRAYFDISYPVQNDGKWACPHGSKPFHAYSLDAGATECVTLKSGLTAQQKIEASRLETSRYASWLGGTNEFTKGEGITFDSDRKDRIYITFSRIYRTMTCDVSASSYEWLGQNDICVKEENPYGCIYKMKLDDDYSGTNMKPIACGSTNSTTAELAAFAEPDNIGYVKGHDAILIQEDSSKRDRDGVNYANFAWLYGVSDHTMVPYAQSIMGSEFSSGYHYQAGGWNYILLSNQHPYNEGSKTPKPPASCDALGKDESCGDLTGTGDWLLYYKWPIESSAPGTSPNGRKRPKASASSITIFILSVCFLLLL